MAEIGRTIPFDNYGTRRQTHIAVAPVANFPENLRTIVSIGTGIPDMTDFGDDMLAIGRTVLDIATETQTTANEFHRTNSDLDDEGKYYRFNVARGLASIGLEEASESKRIKELTDVYLTEQSTYSSIRKCAKTLGDSIISVTSASSQSMFV